MPCESASIRRSCAMRRSHGSRTGTGSAASSAGGSWSRCGSSLLRRDVGAREAAVDEEGRGGHVGAVVAGQEEGALRDLSGLGEAAHRQVNQAARGLLGILREQLLEQR